MPSSSLTDERSSVGKYDLLGFQPGRGFVPSSSLAEEQSSDGKFDLLGVQPGRDFEPSSSLAEEQPWEQRQRSVGKFEPLGVQPSKDVMPSRSLADEQQSVELGCGYGPRWGLARKRCSRGTIEQLLSVQFGKDFMPAMSLADEQQAVDLGFGCGPSCGLADERRIFDPGRELRKQPGLQLGSCVQTGVPLSVGLRLSLSFRDEQRSKRISKCREPTCGMQAVSRPREQEGPCSVQSVLRASGVRSVRCRNELVKNRRGIHVGASGTHLCISR